MSLSRSKLKISNTNEQVSMNTSTPGIKTNPSNNLTFVQKFIEPRADVSSEDIYKFCEKWRSLSLACLRWKKRATDELASMTPSTSGIETNSSDDFVENIIIELVENLLKSSHKQQLTSEIKTNSSNDVTFVNEIGQHIDDVFPFFKGHAHLDVGKEELKKELLKSHMQEPACSTPEFKTSTASSTSGMKTNDSDNIIVIKERIDRLADELYAMARKKIGGTVVINHLGEKTDDWDAIITFINRQSFNQPYKPGAFKKIFKSKGPEQDGAAIFYLADGLIDSVSAKLPIMKHDCKQCADRGTRHSSACSFSNFAGVPIIVISEEKGQVSLFLKGRAQIGIDKKCFKKELLKAYETQETISSIYELWSSMGLSMSGENSNRYDEIIFVKYLIDQLADDFYDLASKKIGGSVIINHLCEETSDWHEALETFLSRRPFDQPYKPGIFEKIFTSKGPEENFHDGAVIFYLCYGLIDSVSTILSMMKHKCENKCVSRGTRHISACYFSDTTSIPIIVISEEKGQVSLFWKGRAQLGIGKENLKDRLLRAYVTEKEFWSKHSTFSQHFSRFFNLSPIIPNDDGRYKWFFEYYVKNKMDLYKGSLFMFGGKEITLPQEYYTLTERSIRCKAQMILLLYNTQRVHCLILGYGYKRLGGFFYTINNDSFVLYDNFLLRHLMHDGFAVYFLREVLWKKMFPHCKRLVFFVPWDLTESLADFIEDLNGKEDPSLLVKYQMDPTYNVGFVAELS